MVLAGTLLSRPSVQQVAWGERGPAAEEACVEGCVLEAGRAKRNEGSFEQPTPSRGMPKKLCPIRAARDMQPALPRPATARPSPLIRVRQREVPIGDTGPLSRSLDRIQPAVGPIALDLPRQGCLHTLVDFAGHPAPIAGTARASRPRKTLDSSRTLAAASS